MNTMHTTGFVIYSRPVLRLGGDSMVECTKVGTATQGAQSRVLTPETLRMLAKKDGIDENEPTLMRAAEALEQLESGTITTAEELDAAFEELQDALDAFADAHPNK
jgi:hypothetical protein